VGYEMLACGIAAEACIWRKVAEPGAHPFGPGQDVLGVESGGAGGGLEQSGEDAHQGGLARAVRSEEAEHPDRDVEVHALESGDRAGVDLDETPDLNHGAPRGPQGGERVTHPVAKITSRTPARFPHLSHLRTGAGLRRVDPAPDGRAAGPSSWWHSMGHTLRGPMALPTSDRDRRS